MSKKVTKNIVRIIFLFIIFLLSIFFNSNEIFATEGDTIATGTSGDCTYTITELSDGTYSVTISGEGAMEDYSSYSSSPFYTYRSYISEVYVEDGITTIGTYSFAARGSSSSYRYTQLALVDLSNCTTLTSIGNYAFYYCSNLTSIDFLDDCKSTLESIGDYAFGYWTNLTEIDLSNYTALTYLSGFYCCSSLTSVNLSGCTALTSIGNYAFYYCSNLTSIDFLDDYKSTLESIGNNAFRYWTNLTEIDLSDYTALTSIGNYAFNYCSSLTDLDLSGCTALTSIGIWAFGYCSSLTDLDLSGCTNLTSIRNNAFCHCTGLAFLTASGCTSLEKIGSECFFGCTKLVSADFSGCASLESLEATFCRCIALVNADFSDCVSLTSIGEIDSTGGCFDHCEALVKVNLSGCSSLTEIGYRAFSDCKSLTSMDLSDCVNLSLIGERAFEYCTNLTDINLFTCVNLTCIEVTAFYDCISLESIDLSNCTKLEKIGRYTFENCSNLKEVILPTSIKDIDGEAFCYCVKLENINLGDCSSLTSIEQYAFYCCENLKNIEFPDSLYSIHNYAFDYTALEEIDLSNCSNLSYIGRYAFYRTYDNYSENINIYLPKNTTIEIGYAGLYQNRIDLGWYGIWSGIYYIDSSGVGYYYTSSDDSYYAYLAFIPSGISRIEIPSSITVDEVEYSVTGLECFSLQYASDLEEITFEDGSKITYLEEYSFAYCENLTTINGYSTSDEIMENVFYNVSTDYEYTLFECTNIDTTYNLIVYFTFDYYEYFTYETEIDDISEITLELYCDGEVIEEVTINKSEMFGTVYTFKDLELGHEYYVDLKHNLDGWGANIRYYYSGNSTLTYEWIDIARIYAYTIDIDWNDEESTGERPSEVEVVLYDEDGNEYVTAILNEENSWSYTFYVNNFSSAYTINYSYETVEYTATIVAEDSIIEADIISYEVNYDDVIEISTQESTCWATNNSTTYYPGATISLTYTEMTPTLESVIEKTGTTEITSSADTVTYNITYTAEVDDYKGDVSLVLTDTLPYEIDESASDLADGTYDNETQTISWEEEVDTVNTYSNDEAATITITKTITVLYEDIDLTDESFTNDVEATIELLALSDSESATWTETAEDDAETAINVDGELVVKYVDLITNEEISDSVTTSGKVGESYDISDYGKEIDGYTLVEEPEEKTGTYTEEAQEKIYYYIENTSITVTKIWDDNDDYAEKRPSSITIVLYKDGEELEKVEITESGEVSDEEEKIDDSSENNNEDSETLSNSVETADTKDDTTSSEWTYTFEDLLKYNTDGTEVEYTVEEELEVEDIENYSSSVDGYTITNTYIGDSIINQKKAMATEYGEDYVMLGEIITYSIIVTNNGENAKDVVIADTVPEKTTFVSGSIKIDGNETYNGEDFSTKTASDLESGITVNIEGDSYITLSFEVTVNDDAKGEISNIGTVNDEETNEVTITIDDSAVINVYYVDKIDDTILDSYSYTGVQKEVYTTEAKDFDGYTLVESPDTETYILTKTEINVYYYYSYNCEVEVNYIDYNTGEILDSYDLEGLEGEAYITEEKSFTDYILIETPDNAIGEYTKEKIIVNYYYSNMYDYTIYYYYDGILDETATETGTAEAGSTVTAPDKGTEIYILDEINTLAQSMVISSTDENILRIYYIKTATLIVNYIDEVTGEILYTYSEDGYEGKSYTTESIEIDDYVLVETPENSSDEMEYPTTTVNYYYRMLSDVVTKYVNIVTGEEIEESITETYKEGDEYDTEQKDISGYRYVSDTGNTSGTIEREDIEVIYYYVELVGINITKVSQSDTDTTLKGVEFSLYSLICEDSSHTHDIDTDLIDVENVDESCWELVGTYESDKNGIIELSNLPITGIYRLVETKTVKNYVLPAGQWKIEFDYGQLDENETITVDGVEMKITAIGNPPALSLVNGTLYLYNEESFDMPTTGGLGATDINKIGITIVSVGLCFIILTILKKRNLVSTSKNKKNYKKIGTSGAKHMKKISRMQKKCRKMQKKVDKMLKK